MKWYKDKYSTKSKIQVREFGEGCPERTELILISYKPLDYEQIKIC